MSSKRLCIFWVILFVVVASSAEAVSFLNLYVAEIFRPGSVLEIFLYRHFSTITLEDVKKFKNNLYDPYLGWDYEPSSGYEGVNRAGKSYRMSWGSDGAREDGLAGHRSFITTYGDSFAAGEEVNNDETWQHFLSQQIGKRVANFGTSGYGTDQALMKFKLHIHQSIISPVSILSIHEENIGRIINHFRPFYRPKDGLTLGFKPRFSCLPTGILVLKPNPLETFREDIQYLRSLAESLVEADPYAREKIRLTAPYSLRLMQLGAEFLRRRFGAESWLVPGSLDLWAKPETAHLMRCIVDDFIDLCRRSHSKPVVLFIPRSGKPNSHGEAPAYDRFMRQLKIRHRDAVIVDLGAQEFDPKRIRVTPSSGHLSPYGNRVVATTLRHALKL